MNHNSTAALAVLGALALSAQAQTNVTIYGIADVAIERFKTEPGASTLNMSSGVQSGSRVGFRGTEDLGSGLSASFVLENGFDISSGSLGQGGRLFGRQAWVGLNGNFGSVKLGRQYTPLFLAVDTVDPFDAGITGDGSGTIALFRHYGVRMDNTVTYSIGGAGLSGQLAYGFGEVPGSTATRRQLGGLLNYTTGPLTAVLGFHSQNTASSASADTGNGRTLMVGATYALGPVKLHGAYAANRDVIAADTVVGRSRDVMLGATIQAGTGSILVALARHDDRFGAGADDATFWQAGYTHPLSKRTNFYTSYSIIKNSGAGVIGGAVPGGDVSWLNAGVRHVF